VSGKGILPILPLGVIFGTGGERVEEHRQTLLGLHVDVATSACAYGLLVWDERWVEVVLKVCVWKSRFSSVLCLCKPCLLQKLIRW
jgi:hypothetical protein